MMLNRRYSFFTFLCLLFLALTQSKKPNVKLSNEVIEDVLVNAATYTKLPITYYTQGELTLLTQPGAITYAQLIQCNDSRAGLPNIMISIILGSNVNFSNNAPFSLLEISTCADSWSTSCVIATNYLYNSDDILQAFNTVTIPYNISAQTLYLRLKSEIAQTSVSIHVSYVDDSYPLFSGEFVPSLFNSIQQGNNWNYFYQLAKNDEISTVQTGKSAFYYINFCEDAILSPEYSVTVTVTGLPSTPLAGFDLAECAAAVVKFANCQVYNGNLNGISATQFAATTTFVELNSGSVSLSGGIYINVFGYGGEIDGNNDFILSIIETPYT